MKYKMFVFGLLLALGSSCDIGLPEQPIESAVAPENTLISKIAPPTLEQHSMPFKINCPDLLDELPASSVFVGSLIMWGRDNNVPLMVMNLKTRGQKTFSDQTYSISAGQLSPNRKWVAFQDTKALKLLLIDANGNLSEVTDWDKNWSGIITWLGDEQLLISETRESDLNPIGILNINTKEYRELGYDYPYHPKSWHERSPWLISTIYNPSMTQVVYPGFSVDHSESSLIVLDLQTEQIKAELPNYDNEAVSPPKWSPDGSKLLIPKENGEGKYF